MSSFFYILGTVKDREIVPRTSNEPEITTTKYSRLPISRTEIRIFDDVAILSNVELRDVVLLRQHRIE